MPATYTDTTTCVVVSGEEHFRIDAGVRQGCKMAPDMFDTSIDWVMEQTIHRAMNWVSVGSASFSDLDFADGVSLVSELVGLLDSALIIFQEVMFTNKPRG